MDVLKHRKNTLTTFAIKITKFQPKTLKHHLLQEENNQEVWILLVFSNQRIICFYIMSLVNWLKLLSFYCYYDSFGAMNSPGWWLRFHLSFDDLKLCSHPEKDANQDGCLTQWSTERTELWFSIFGVADPVQWTKAIIAKVYEKIRTSGK